MLELRNISKKFGDKQILKDFNLIVPEKQVLAILDLQAEGRRPFCVCWQVWRQLIRDK